MSAFSVETSGTFDDDDGLWSTFNMDVGTGTSGPQSFTVIVSTSSFSALLPGPQSCQIEGVPKNCSSSRGIGQHAGTQSSGYNGSYSGSQLPTKEGLEILLLGTIDINATFGENYAGIGAQVWLDYMSLRGSGSFQTYQSQISIYALSSGWYWMATIGIGYGVIALTSGIRANSTLRDMVAKGAIPSPSWAYTAGAYYGKNSSGSVTPSSQR
jgi:hypothetical protein